MESEFNYESEGGYELAPEFEIHDESETESLLENVTNEEEFHNYVKGIAQRDHRSGNLHSVLNHPAGRMAMHHMYNIGRRTIPRFGIRAGGWRGSGYGDRYGNSRWGRPGYWRRYGNQPYPPYPDPNAAAPGYPPTDPASSPTSPTSGDPSAPSAPSDQGGNFKKFVLDTLNNLGQQIASGNDTLAALKSSMTNSAAANYPSIVQPATDPGSGAPPAAAPPQPAPDASGQPAGSKEFDFGFEYEMETEGEVRDSQSSFNEETEMDLASDLLAVKNEQELDHFLGDLFKKAVGAASGLLGGGGGGRGGGGGLGGMLKSLVKTALPTVAGIAGTAFGGPIGGMIGGQLGSAASGLFEMELEGMSNEDREFETARAIVRFAGNAARQVADDLGVDPQADVKKGITEAAALYAPGLLVKDHHHHDHHHHGHHQHGHHHHDEHHHGHHHHHSGTWYRSGDRLIIENI